MSDPVDSKSGRIRESNPPLEKAGSGRRRIAGKPWLIGGVLIVTGLVIWRLTTASTFPPELAVSMSAAEKRQILSEVRDEGFRRSWGALKNGSFRAALGWFNSSWRHKIVSVARQGDGDVWVHVGIQDRNQPGGYSIWSRHILRKQNGQWRIIWSF